MIITLKYHSYNLFMIKSIFFAYSSCFWENCSIFSDCSENFRNMSSCLLTRLLRILIISWFSGLATELKLVDSGLVLVVLFPGLPPLTKLFIFTSDGILSASSFYLDSGCGWSMDFLTSFLRSIPLRRSRTSFCSCSEILGY